jgi:hypothetical protein
MKNHGYGVTPSGADATTEDEGGLSGFDQAHGGRWLALPQKDNLVMVSDTSTAQEHQARVWQKVDCPLIRQPPKQPSAAKSVLPLLSKVYGGGSEPLLSAYFQARCDPNHVAYGSINALGWGLSTPKCVGKIDYEELIKAGSNASNVEALYAFFSDENWSHIGNIGDTRPLLRLHRWP